MNKAAMAFALLVLPAGCGSKQPQANAPEPTATASAPASASAPVPPVGLSTDAWVGKWAGVEGLALDIEKSATPGVYALTINLLDGASSYIGTAQGDRITFMRNGEKEAVRRATGAETGLKWLSGKRGCLMIKNGEGFCRD